MFLSGANLLIKGRKGLTHEFAHRGTRGRRERVVALLGGLQIHVHVLDPDGFVFTELGGSRRSASERPLAKLQRREVELRERTDQELLARKIQHFQGEAQENREGLNGNVRLEIIGS